MAVAAPGPGYGRLKRPCVDRGGCSGSKLSTNLKMACAPINTMTCLHSRRFPFLLGLAVVLDCALFLAMPGGGLINPAPLCADKGDVEEHSRDGEGWVDTRDGNEYYQDMDQLNDERDRELSLVQEEYDRELGAIEEEFERDSMEEDDPAAAEEKYREKRDSLELKFEEKRRQLAEWYEEKASDIEGR